MSDERQDKRNVSLVTNTSENAANIVNSTKKSIAYKYFVIAYSVFLQVKYLTYVKKN